MDSFSAYIMAAFANYDQRVIYLSSFHLTPMYCYLTLISKVIEVSVLSQIFLQTRTFRAVVYPRNNRKVIQITSWCLNLKFKERSVHMGQVRLSEIGYTEK